MGNYPWGPHGPQSGPNQVTPNPTPAYVPPPSSPTYYPPAASPGYSYGSGSAGSGGIAGPRGPRSKSYVLALILTFLFGPLGLLYASKKGALVMLFLLVAVPVSLAALGVLPGASPAHPFAILDRTFVMDRMWSISVVLSMLWAVVAVILRNAAIRALAK